MDQTTIESAIAKRVSGCVTWVQLCTELIPAVTEHAGPAVGALMVWRETPGQPFQVRAWTIGHRDPPHVTHTIASHVLCGDLEYLAELNAESERAAMEMIEDRFVIGAVHRVTVESIRGCYAFTLDLGGQCPKVWLLADHGCGARAG